MLYPPLPCDGEANRSGHGYVEVLHRDACMVLQRGAQGQARGLGRRVVGLVLAGSIEPDGFPGHIGVADVVMSWRGQAGRGRGGWWATPPCCNVLRACMVRA